MAVLPTSSRVHFFLVVSSRDARDTLPELIELPQVPHRPENASHDADKQLRSPDAASSAHSRPLYSPPLALGRSSPCLLWALKNNLACSRRLLEFSSWHFGGELPAAGNNISTSRCAEAVRAHGSASRCGVRLCCKNHNRLVSLHRFSPPSADGGKDRQGAVAECLPRSVTTWLRVGDTLSVAGGAVQLQLSALRVVHETAASGPGRLQDAQQPLCWYAGSEAGSSTRSSTSNCGARHAGGKPSPAVAAPALDPPLPQVGIRAPLTWQQLPKSTRQEMMLTCWTKWSSWAPPTALSCTSSSHSPAVSCATPQPPVQGRPTVDMGVQTSPARGEYLYSSERTKTLVPADPLAGSYDGPEDLILVETAPAHSSTSSSRSSATAGEANREGSASHAEVEAATPTYSQTDDRHRYSQTRQVSAAPTSQHRHRGTLPCVEGGTRRRTLSQVSQSQRTQQSSSTPPMPLTGASCQLGGTHRSSLISTASPDDVGGRFTCGETLDPNLDDALAQLEQHAALALPLSSGPRQRHPGDPQGHLSEPGLLGADDEDEDGGDSGALLPREDTMEKHHRHSSRPRSSKGRRSGGGATSATTQRGSKKRSRQSSSEGASRGGRSPASRTAALRRERSSLTSGGTASPRTRSTVSRTHSGLGALPPPTKGKDGFPSSTIAGQNAPSSHQYESQEVFFQH